MQRAGRRRGAALGRSRPTRHGRDGRARGPGVRVRHRERLRAAGVAGPGAARSRNRRALHARPHARRTCERRRGIATASGLHLHLEEAAIPVREDVRGACEVLGFDPCYVANEGRFIVIVAPADADRALAILRDFDVSQARCAWATWTTHTRAWSRYEPHWRHARDGYAERRAAPENLLDFVTGPVPVTSRRRRRNCHVGHVRALGQRGPAFPVSGMPSPCGRVYQGTCSKPGDLVPAIVRNLNGVLGASLDKPAKAKSSSSSRAALATCCSRPMVRPRTPKMPDTEAPRRSPGDQRKFSRCPHGRAIPAPPMWREVVDIADGAWRSCTECSARDRDATRVPAISRLSISRGHRSPLGAWPRHGDDIEGRVGRQSTMNSLAPVRVEDRWAASPSSETW